MRNLRPNPSFTQVHNKKTDMTASELLNTVFTSYQDKLTYYLKDLHAKHGTIPKEQLQQKVKDMIILKNMGILSKYHLDLNDLNFAIYKFTSNIDGNTYPIFLNLQDLNFFTRGFEMLLFKNILLKLNESNINLPKSEEMLIKNYLIKPLITLFKNELVHHLMDTYGISFSDFVDVCEWKKSEPESWQASLCATGDLMLNDIPNWSIMNICDEIYNNFHYRSWNLTNNNAYKGLEVKDDNSQVIRNVYEYLLTIYDIATYITDDRSEEQIKNLGWNALYERLHIDMEDVIEGDINYYDAQNELLVARSIGFLTDSVRETDSENSERISDILSSLNTSTSSEILSNNDVSTSTDNSSIVGE